MSNLSEQQFTGWMPTSSLRRTEDTEGMIAAHPRAREYQNALEKHIKDNENEMPGLPLKVRYSYSSGLGKNVGWVEDGNHRHLAAEHLGISHMKVKARSRRGKPAEMDEPERDEWGEV